MGIEGRDWYRKEPRRRRSALARVQLLVVVVVGAALVLAVSPPVRERLGYELPLGLENVFVFRKDTTPGALRLQPFPDGPSVTIREQPLYAPDDPWRAWLADEATCPRGEDAAAPAAVQIRAMLCLVNFARAREGLPELALSPVLTRAAASKAFDIVRCGRFEHEACGAPAEEAARRHGYAGSFGENLFLAEGRLAAPRVAVDRWLNSEGHRRNLFLREWRTMGLAVLPDAALGGARDGVLWVQHFGD